MRSFSPCVKNVEISAILPECAFPLLRCHAQGSLSFHLSYLSTSSLALLCAAQSEVPVCPRFDQGVPCRNAAECSGTALDKPDHGRPRCFGCAPACTHLVALLYLGTRTSRSLRVCRNQSPCLHSYAHVHLRVSVRRLTPLPYAVGLSSSIATELPWQHLLLDNQHGCACIESASVFLAFSTLSKTCLDAAALQVRETCARSAGDGAAIAGPAAGGAARAHRAGHQPAHVDAHPGAWRLPAHHAVPHYLRSPEVDQQVRGAPLLVLCLIINAVLKLVSKCAVRCCSPLQPLEPTLAVLYPPAACDGLVPVGFLVYCHIGTLPYPAHL